MHKHAHGCFLHTNLQNNLRIKMHRDSHAEAHTHTETIAGSHTCVYMRIWTYKHMCLHTHTQAHTLLAQQWSRLPIAESQIHLASALSLLSLSPSLQLYLQPATLLLLLLLLFVSWLPEEKPGLLFLFLYLLSSHLFSAFHICQQLALLLFLYLLRAFVCLHFSQF